MTGTCNNRTIWQCRRRIINKDYPNGRNTNVIVTPFTEANLRPGSCVVSAFYAKWRDSPQSVMIVIVPVCYIYKSSVIPQQLETTCGVHL